MTETGRGAARTPITVSPDTAKPAPAGHKCGRRTSACNPSTTSEIAMAPRTTVRSAFSRITRDCSACDILHKLSVWRLSAAMGVAGVTYFFQ